MTSDVEAFWTAHSGLPRQGPGEPADIAWAARVAGLRPDARILDAGCGPGADFAALLAAAPEGHVTGIEKHADFVEEAAGRNLDRVAVQQGDIGEITGPYDFIWSAGALYFLGITEGLRLWRPALAPGGAVAFSEPCWLVPDPPEDLREFWRIYPPMSDVAGIDARVTAAGWRTLDTRVLSDAAWEAYYTPFADRLAGLQAGGNPYWVEAEREIALWRKHRRAVGYLLSVVRPA